MIRVSKLQRTFNHGNNTADEVLRISGHWDYIFEIIKPFYPLECDYHSEKMIKEDA